MELEARKFEGGLATTLPKILLGLGGVAYIAALGMGLTGDADAKQHFFFSYLMAFMFFLSISLGAMFFVLIQHVTRAGWSVLVRRVAEVLMKNVILMAVLVLLIPFLI